MPILVECDSCGKKYRVGDDRAGRTIECKECFSDIDVPGRRRPTRDAPRQPSGQRPGSPSGMNPLLLIGGAVGVVGLAGVVVLVLVVFMRRGERNNPDPNDIARQARPDFGNRPNVPRGRPANPQRQPNRPNVQPPSGMQPVPRRPQPPALQLAAWRVAVDPPKETYDFDPEKEIRIPTGDRSGAGDMLLPASPTAFVSVGRNITERETSSIYDLRKGKGKKIADVRGVRLDRNMTRLSQDGSYLVGRESRGNGIIVFDVKAEKFLGQIALDSNYRFLQTLDLPGSDRIVATASSKPLVIWSLPSGDVERTIDLPRSFDRESMSFSPGGRYMTVIRDSRKILSVYDLDTGNVAGELASPLDERGSAEKCKGLIFSPDGKELAGLFGFGKSRLVSWDVADGKVVVDLKFEESLQSTIKGAHSYRAHPLEWFPDRSKWLVYGHAIVDRDLGGPVWMAPVDPVGTAARRVIDDDRVLTLAGPRDGRVVASLKLPHEQIEQAISLIRSGGTADDAGLPPLTNTDLSRAPTLDTEAPVGDWQVAPDPATDKIPAGLLSRPVQLELAATPVQQAAISRTGRWFAVKTPPPRQTASSRTRRRPPKKSTADEADQPAKPVRPTLSLLAIYDLDRGNDAKELGVTFDCVLMDVNTEGTRCLVKTAGQNQGRLDVFSVDDGQHVVGWRPFKNAKKTNRNVKFARFIGDSHVLTGSASHQLTLWELPTCKAVYTVAANDEPVLSAGRRYFGVRGKSNQQTRIIDVLSGKICGQLDTKGYTNAMAFHPDGNHLATVANTTVQLWRMSDGSLDKEFDVAQSSNGKLRWCGDRYLFAGARSLIDTENELIVWTYSVQAGGNGLSHTPDGRYWYYAPSVTKNGAITLAAIDLPHEQAATTLSATSLKAKTVMGPGSVISLNVAFSGGSDATKVTNDFRRRVTDALQRYGITVAAGQPLVLNANMSRRSTGKTLEYEVSESTRFGIKRNKRQISIPETKLDCHVSISFRGKSYHERKGSFSNDVVSFFDVRLPEGKSAEQYVSERQWESAKSFARGYAPPKIIYAIEARYGFGKSILRANGIAPSPLPRSQ